MTQTPKTKDEYIAMCLSWGRKYLLSLLHRQGLKQGYLKLSDRQLAEILYAHAHEALAAAEKGA